MTRISTQVSKADPGIKKILAAAAAMPEVAEWAAGSGWLKWRGLRVFVVQVDPGWIFSLYNDASEPHVCWMIGVGTSKLAAYRVHKPSYGMATRQISAPSYGEAVVTREIGTNGTVTIFVPTLDPATLEIARDALLEGNPDGSPLVLGLSRFARILEDLGPYAGVGGAIVKAQSKMLEKATSGKTSSQIKREIAEILKSGSGR